MRVQLKPKSLGQAAAFRSRRDSGPANLGPECLGTPGAEIERSSRGGPAPAGSGVQPPGASRVQSTESLAGSPGTHIPGESMNVPDYVVSYRSHLAHLVETHGREAAMEWIVGGQYLQIGILESSALRTLGLQPCDTLVDIGCGSGRLPFSLKDYLSGRFIGTDILDEALAYAAERCARPDWSFLPHYEASIPVEDGIADFVTFFSVFTHLLDEDIYRFLAEAHRVLKPGGRAVFSFLDFECASHWPIFEATLADRNPHRVINKFISKAGIKCWAQAIGFTPRSRFTKGRSAGSNSASLLPTSMAGGRTGQSNSDSLWRYSASQPAARVESERRPGFARWATPGSLRVL